MINSALDTILLLNFFFFQVTLCTVASHRFEIPNLTINRILASDRERSAAEDIFNDLNDPIVDPKLKRAVNAEKGIFRMRVSSTNHAVPRNRGARRMCPGTIVGSPGCVASGPIFI